MDATLVTAWKSFCQMLEPALAGPTATSLLHVLTGWVLCRSKPTVTNLVRTIGPQLLGVAAQNWTTYEQWFYRRSWSLAAMSRLLLTRVVAPLLASEGDGSAGGPGGPGGAKVIELKIDDTTCGRHGKHVAYAGYFKDASASNVGQAVMRWSHNWVIGAVALRCKRFSSWVTALPVLASLYRKEKDCDGQHPFLTRPQLAAQMVRDVRSALPDWEIRVGVDGAYANQALLGALPANANVVSRLRQDAALFAAAPKRRVRRRGRPRRYGRRLPTPRDLARRRKTGWRTITVRKGGKTVEREVWSLVCLWPRVCGDKPIKLVIVRDPAGKQKDDFFFCTDAGVDEVQIVERAYARWSIEESIQDAKQHHGFDEVQGWCPRTVERQGPLALLVQTLTKAWYLLHGVQARAAQPRGKEAWPWLPAKKHPSYLDMLATLRAVLWDDRINSKSPCQGNVREILKTLRFTLCAMA